MEDNANEGRASGEAFKRVNAEVWSKEILNGLEDNSCKIDVNELKAATIVLAYSNVCMYVLCMRN